jgi:phage tail protein X
LKSILLKSKFPKPWPLFKGTEHLMITYITKDGDVLDAICWKYYGSTFNKTVEKVLEANRHLAELGSIFAAGVKIILPDLTQEEETESIKLWS